MKSSIFSEFPSSEVLNVRPIFSFSLQSRSLTRSSLSRSSSIASSLLDPVTVRNLLRLTLKLTDVAVLNSAMKPLSAAPRLRVEAGGFTRQGLRLSKKWEGENEVRNLGLGARSLGMGGAKIWDKARANRLELGQG